MESFSEIWAMVCENLKETVNEITYNVWLAELTLVSFDDEKIVLTTSPFKKPLIEKKFMNVLDETLQNVLGFPVNIVILADGDDALPKEEKKTVVTRLQTFDTFVVGPNNKFANAAALSVSKKLGQDFNPLIIYGRSGLGKTHLMQAILHKISQDNPNIRAVATTGENFANELISHIFRQDTHKFHKKYRNLDILLVDDVQFIAGKDSTQEEFFHTFNAITEAGGQIVLTSDRPPKDIATLEERLRTRFEMGMIADIKPPDFETRVAIIKRKAQDLDISFPHETVAYIADKLRNNVRQLEGAARRLQAYVKLNGMEPNRATAELVIKDVLEDDAPPAVTLSRIVDEIVRAFNGNIDDIRSKKRDGKTVVMRQAAIYCARQLTSLSMQDIGKEFGRDHSTVLHSLRQMDQEIKTNPQVRAIVNDVMYNMKN